MISYSRLYTSVTGGETPADGYYHAFRRDLKTKSSISWYWQTRAIDAFRGHQTHGTIRYLAMVYCAVSVRRTVLRYPTSKMPWPWKPG